MKKPAILVVDDDADFVALVRKGLEGEGYEIDSAGDAASAKEQIAAREYDLVLADLRLPGESGIELLGHLRENYDTPVVIITAFGSIDSAVEAMRVGAFDYITKPVNKNDLKLVVRRALESRQLKKENRRLKKELTEKHSFSSIVGQSTVMRQLFATLEKVVSTDVTVLIRGESGTGKELVARAIHYNSRRKDGPFVVVNCAAIPGTLLESELFGHEKGAFTGATTQKIGKFELADGGTIFLDEIGDMSYELQSKLLRVLQGQEFERVGGNERIRTDVRIISATHQDLLRGIQEGTFREDLYYRLNVFPIFIPPLRERKSDIPLLAEHFVRKYNERHGRAVKGLSDEALKALVAYDWPGNVRELENYIERAVVACDGEVIDVADLPFEVRPPRLIDKAYAAGVSLPTSLPDLVERLEREYILRALEEGDWVQVRASQLLGITERMLGYKMQKYGIKRPRK